jgi:hypothetical protein
MNCRVQMMIPKANGSTPNTIPISNFSCILGSTLNSVSQQSASEAAIRIVVVVSLFQSISYPSFSCSCCLSLLLWCVMYCNAGCQSFKTWMINNPSKPELDKTKAGLSDDAPLVRTVKRGEEKCEVWCSYLRCGGDTDDGYYVCWRCRSERSGSE